MGLLESIDSWASRAPDRVAHRSSGQALTYGELVRRSDTLAGRLAADLPDDRSPVVVLGHKEPEMLIAFLGAAKSGHPYVPVDTALPAQRVEKIKLAAGASLVITPGDVARLSDGASPRPSRELREEDPYYVIFTSGSTGEPKGVVITLGCLQSFVDWMLAEQRLEPEAEVFLNQAPFSFDLSVMDLYLSLVTGGTLVSVTRQEVESPKRLYQALGASNVTVWVSTPSFAQLCLVEPGFSRAMLPAVRKLLFCGETLAPDVAAELLDRFPGAEVWNTYGPTEATVATTSIEITRDALAKYPTLPVGYPKPDTRIRVLDEMGGEVPDGEQGEISIAGPNVSPGYIGRPDLTDRVFSTVDGLRAYLTGDLGRYRDGLLFFEGRMDSQVKLHGYRIELGDVEANLRALPEVRDAVVVVSSKPGQPDALAAFVVPAKRPNGSDFEISLALRAQLAERLPDYMLPRRFLLLEAFPMTANGKADRRRLVGMLG